MPNDYNIIEWNREFEKNKGSFDYKTDALETRNRVLYPGRFYILNYKSDTKKVYNARPVIISLGVSSEHPDMFIGIDLCVMPMQVRLNFMKMFWGVYGKEINRCLITHYDIKNVDLQPYFKDFNYANIKSTNAFSPVVNAIKKYKISNTMKIYALPYERVYKVIGSFCDVDRMINGKLADVQKEFINKSLKKK